MYIGTLVATSNQADWIVDYELNDPVTGDPIDLTGASIFVALRDGETRGTLLSGVVGSGVTITGAAAGTFTSQFTPAQMRSVPPGEHEVFVRVTLASGLTEQLIAGMLPVIDGGPAA